ncbi:glycerophosphodiester phosphodiesterase family protein [Paenirhodobacter populi]
MMLAPDFLRLPFAHRGYHDAERPENSLSAARAAIAAGYGIECDLQLSSDGVPVVFHDYDLRRLTGRAGRVQMQTADELAATRISGSDDTIPTLTEFLAEVAGRVPLLVEIKDQDGGMGPTDGRLEAAAAQLLRDYKGPLAVMSFNPHAIEAFRRTAPGIAVGLTTSAYGPDWTLLPPATRDRLRAIPDYDRLGCDFISHEASDLNNPRVAELKAAGARILCWTIRSPEAEEKARRVAHNITFENYPAPIPA